MLMHVPNTFGDLFSWKFLPLKYHKSELLAKLNRFTVYGPKGSFRQRALDLAPLDDWARLIAEKRSTALFFNVFCFLPYIRLYVQCLIWAPSSEFVSSSIPSWQTLTAHAQPFRGARDLAFCLKVPLDSLLVWASSEGSGETARMRRLAWTFAARIGDKYQIRLTRSIYILLVESCAHAYLYSL